MRSLSCALWITLIVVVALNGILMMMFIGTMNESNRLASEETDRVLLELTRLVEKPLPYWMDDIYAKLPREVQERIHWVEVEETELCLDKLLGGMVVPPYNMKDLPGTCAD